MRKKKFIAWLELNKYTNSLNWLVRFIYLYIYLLRSKILLTKIINYLTVEKKEKIELEKNFND